jgi:hypothetical protein
MALGWLGSENHLGELGDSDIMLNTPAKKTNAAIIQKQSAGNLFPLCQRPSRLLAVSTSVNKRT